MNLVILQDSQFLDEHHVRLGQTYAQHFTTVLKCKVGDRITVGRLNGGIGEATVVELSPEHVHLKVIHLAQTPPSTLPVTLVLGLPRPRMLQRSLQTIATMGVERLCLIQTARVEKSFWQTPLLTPETVEQQLILGLEQGKATQLPHISLHKRFHEFVADELPGLMQERECLLAHPGNYPPCPSQGRRSTLLMVGPEGGFIGKEVNSLLEKGFTPVQLGQRILRVETAIPVLLSKLFY